VDPYQYLLILATVLIMGAFGGGVLYNIRRGNAVLRWMQTGLPLIGEKTTLRWLGSSVVELHINKAKPPFRRFSLAVVLQPRDVPWLWLWSIARNRRDMVILRGTLTTTPRLEYDVLAPQSWTGRTALDQAKSAQWGTEAMEDLLFAAPKASLPVSSPTALQALKAARQVDPTIWRLSIRREHPQIELHIPLPKSSGADAREFFETVRSLARQAMGE
jgi:hypothetical protein